MKGRVQTDTEPSGKPVHISVHCRHVITRFPIKLEEVAFRSPHLVLFPGGWGEHEKNPVMPPVGKTPSCRPSSHHLLLLQGFL